MKLIKAVVRPNKVDEVKDEISGAIKGLGDRLKRNRDKKEEAEGPAVTEETESD